MYHHMIIMISNYKDQTRIAYTECYDSIYLAKSFKNKFKELKSDFPNMKFTLHHIQTDSESIKSVIDYDRYFKNVKFYYSYEFKKFKEDIHESKKIVAADIMKYLLSRFELTKIEVLKLIYFIYEEYAKNHETPLFEDRIEAWDYGPVIPDVYFKLSPYYREKIDIKDKESEKIKFDLKVATSENKKDIMEAIDNVICKYNGMEPFKLVDITHKKGGPWDIVYQKSPYGEITFELIKLCNS